MRVMVGRGDWCPGIRIEGLRRYAFIGDSYMYGHGVAPDQTLPANAERQMNELLLGWPVEAVNLGVCGYNLWNSWLAFKHGPQVYDGVVLGLCNNDSELFGRTYNATYPEPHEMRWEGTHPFGAAVARCFDDIASFSREFSLPIAVVYFNISSAAGQLRICEIIRHLCATHGFCFIDSFDHYRDRNFALADLVVSSADCHPSAMAHEALGRHLAAILRRQGWFSESEPTAIGAAPGRILTEAQAMVETDHYPPDAALHWALRALDAKCRVAGRMQTSEDEFGTVAARARVVLTSATHCWHIAKRARALAAKVQTTRHGVVAFLFHVQAERLKVEELGFVLQTGDWKRLTVYLPEAELPWQTADTWLSDMQRFLEKCGQEVLQFRSALDRVRSFVVHTTMRSVQDDISLLTDLEVFSRLADRIQTECNALHAEFLRVERIYNDARPLLSEREIAQISSLFRASLKRVKEMFHLVPQLSAAVNQMCDAGHASFTTVEVTISGAMEGKPVCMLSGHIEYSVPNRLPSSDVGLFWLDGAAHVVKLRFPLFYAGHLILRPPFRHGPIEVCDRANLLKVEIYNQQNQRQIVEPTSFYRDQNGYFVSPVVYLQR